MTISNEARTFIKRHEAFEPDWYKCSADVWTIGYGHAVFVKYRDPSDEDLPDEMSAPLTRAQAEALLDSDIDRFEQCVNKLVDVKLTQGQFDALVSFAFNVGCGRNGLAGSTLLDLLNDTAYEQAAEEFERWIYAGGEKLDGLVNRRRGERSMFESDTEGALAIETKNLTPVPVRDVQMMETDKIDPEQYPIRTVA